MMEVVSHACIEVEREKRGKGRGAGGGVVKMHNACLQIICRCVALGLSGVLHSKPFLAVDEERKY